MAEGRIVSKLYRCDCSKTPAVS